MFNQLINDDLSKGKSNTPKKLEIQGNFMKDQAIYNIYLYIIQHSQYFMNELDKLQNSPSHLITYFHTINASARFNDLSRKHF